MHKNIEEIKKLESPPIILKKLFSESEINKFLNLYISLPTTVHNKKQNVIKKRWLKDYSVEMETLFYDRVKMKLAIFEWIILMTRKVMKF